MGDASYGTYQLSLKAGNDLLNIAAADAEELFSRIDALFEGGGKDVVARFFVTNSFAPQPAVPTATVPSTQSAPSIPISNMPDGRPTDKQIAFAKKLGIQNAELLTRRELSAQIDKRKPK